MELSRDKIKEIINDDWLLMDDCEGNKNCDVVKEMARIALASLEAEPVAWLLSGGGAKNNVSFDSGNAYADPLREVTPLYTAPPAPVSVPAAMEIDDDFDSAFEHGKAVGWNAYRAAMLQGADGTLTNEGTIPVTQFKPVADLYGLTSPTGGETSFTFDAVEARDFIDGGWSCQEYVELGRFQEAMLQNGNSPAQSDCCPEQNYIAPAQDGDYPVIPDGWIPVSERMPGSQEWVIVFAKWDNQQVLCWDDVANRWTDFEDQSYYADMFTHWMPLPAAPQQEA
ncbi:TPA: DUF551 domain-containing protein [Enterobacter hormaechei subsp. hoffmannii]|uniref:DUF551 domain-containing protein n=1 Tax=Enterobacter hormaechei TaxID=158836 RepID=UPI00125B3CBD|nr:DUF551 domain-containing protein [Enterobacter hormaechei]VAK92244.1 Protein of uncharacterised function (DUF551) [Enterobacter hormaechei]